MAAISSSERGLDDLLVYSLLRHACRELIPLSLRNALTIVKRAQRSQNT
ncbi:MAG: hypothetical protein P4L87_06970 [Formivibrio sp.]|nr:hypothetical protein [Formivibrio sp.]